jgi:hypothetical protein
MKNFDERVHQVIMETVDVLREDINLSSPAAKNTIAMDIFVGVMRVCNDFLIHTPAADADESLMLED